MYGVIRLLKMLSLVRDVVIAAAPRPPANARGVSRSRPVHTLLLAVTLQAAAGMPAEARQRPASADVIGVVRDQLNAVLSEATVSATNVDTKIVRTVSTDAGGRYTLAALPPGTYDVSAAHAGFTTQVFQAVTVPLGMVLELEFVLGLAAITQQVDVVADMPSVDAQGTAVAPVVTQHQITNLPINRRNFVDFAVLTPGVHRDYTPQTGGAAATSGLTFLGQRARSNNITVDGLDNNDIVVGSVRATFSQEAVREFQVLAHTFSAEFGKASGGVLNIVTRSGGNAHVGNAFYFYRGDALNARNYFEKWNAAGQSITRDKAPFQQQQFGGTLGGPVRRNRTFYFVSLERLKIDTNNFVNIDDRNQVLLFGQPIGTTADILRSAGFPLETGNVPYEVKSTQALGKIDHQLGSNNSLTVRVNWADDLDENIEPWGGLTARSGGALLDSTDFMVAATHTIVPSSRIINELRGQVAQRSQDVFSLDPTCMGPCDRVDRGGPGIEVIGFATAGRHRFTPQPRENLRYQLLNTTTYVAGNYQLKFGGDYNYINHSRQSLPLHFGGRYIFSPLPAVPGVLPAPLSAIQAFALGLPAAYVQGFGIPDGPLGYSDLSLFMQHDWRPRDNTTVKLGLRYQVQFWPNVVTDIPGFGEHTLDSDYSNLAPRLAIAWHPRNRRDLRVHAAYGIYFDSNLTSYPGINEILDGESGVRTLVLPFPFSQTGWQAPGHKLPESAFGASPSVVFAVGPGTVTPYAHHTAAGVTHDFANHTALSATFVHVRGFDHIASLEFNPYLPELGPFRRPLDVADPATGMKIPGSSTSVLQSTSWGQTWYTGLTLAASRRFHDDFQLLASYTVGTAEDNSSDYTSAFLPENSGKGRNPTDPAGLPLEFDPESERGASLQHRQHQLVLSGTYLFPAEIQVAGIVRVGSGRPYNILAGVDLNQDGDGGGPPPDRARRDISNPASSVPRNLGRLPIQSSVDLRVTRRFNVGSRLRVDAMFEVFNLLNRANFSEINNIFGVGSYPSEPLPTYGQFEQAGPPRQVQLGVKLNF